ncbi:MAG: winged helix-turn-helix domain-containing protein [Stellaceae bacterium]
MPPRLTLRIDLAPGQSVGPGKMRLLEAVAETGSISSAGRALGMSYRRAWMLIEQMNQGFRRKVVTTKLGGTRGGGAVLTPFGRDMLRRYRAIEASAARAGKTHLAFFARVARPQPRGAAKRTRLSR